MAAHPDFEILADSWELALRADAYATNTVISYRRALRSLAAWLDEHHPGAAPDQVTREHVRGWLVHIREATSSGTARSWFPGVRKFFRWAVEENECDTDPTDGIRTPPPNQTHTPVLSLDDIRKLLATCSGRGFADRRDAAIIYLFADGGLRLAEAAGLGVDDVDLAARMVFVSGKGSNRSGPRRRAVPIGIKATRALDRYMRDRRRHPYAELSELWLGERNRGPLSISGVDRALERRAASAGLKMHAHMFRHTWASQFRKAGGSEGDLMVLGGWSNRTMLDRYGRAAAEERAQEAYRSRALGDRL
ncbi:tyrosine-type recombinase/integrase [Micromonospora sp. STR1s_5]|nr:tyrosine-type recombinase/integrase [Micromonospora sp. STR1s_5]